MTKLPIDEVMPELVARLREEPNVVLEAPPGAGKTTRVPAALLEAGFGEVLVLEPRRLAARLAARRVAAERGETVGQTVGYQVRFEQYAGPETRLRFLTEGVLTRRLLADPSLGGVGAVVLDEFHERHLEGDLALALLRRLQKTRRPELRLVVMSATLEGAALAEYLGGCGVVKSEGRLYELEHEFTPHSAEGLETRVAKAVERLVGETGEGDVLVFLPGAAEIRRAQRALEGFSARTGTLVLPLYGDLAPEEQDRAVQPVAGRRKVILSTNVAESSVTIEGVRAVVDSGLARVAKDNAWTGLQRVEVQRVARSSATQRAGRAGRLGPGRVIHLYTEAELASRPAHDEPEITRRELGQLCLDLHAAGLRDPHLLQWLDAPPEPALEAAERLLHGLDALDEEGAITAFGRKLARLPLPPRLGALALHGGAAGCALAAELASGARANGRQIEQQLKRLVPGGGALPLAQAIIRAFPDRVARRRRAVEGEKELLLSTGASAVLANEDGVEKARFLVALDLEERPEQGWPVVRRAHAIEAEWLLDLLPQRVKDRSTVKWNRVGERVEAVSALLYDELVLEESRGAMPEPEAAARLLAEKALEAGLHRFAEPEAVEGLLERIRFAGQYGAVGEPDVEEALRGLSWGLRSFGELRELTRDGGLERALLGQLGGEGQRALERLAPERLRLPSGRQAKVHYASGQTPWVASRLQDFFGLSETPRIAGGAVAVVVHLLAPSQRPVQTTQDLAGFWERLYPQLRRELGRRYPRHAWPENPYNAFKD